MYSSSHTVLIEDAYSIIRRNENVPRAQDLTDPGGVYRWLTGGFRIIHKGVKETLEGAIHEILDGRDFKGC